MTIAAAIALLLTVPAPLIALLLTVPAPLIAVHAAEWGTVPHLLLSGG